MAVIDYASISDDPDGPPFRFPPEVVNQPIVIARGESGVWQFTAETVANIDALHDIYIDKPVLNLAEEERPWYDREVVSGNELWRILLLFSSIFASLVIGQIARSVAHWRAAVLEKRKRHLRSVALTTVAKTVVGLCFLVGLNLGVRAPAA